MSVDFEKIIERDDIVFILTPLSCNKSDIYKKLVKFSDIISKNHKLVTIDKSENPDHISYDEFAKYQNEKNNTYFFIDNIQFFIYYNIEYYNRSNSIIILLDILDIKKFPIYYKDYQDKKGIILYPKSFCIDISLHYRKVRNYITGDQLTFYKKEYLEYIRKPLKEKKESPAKYLNIYFDKIISSLEATSLEQALLRSPKFKTIFLEILTKNKKRHIIHLVDNKYGLESFVVVYNKLNTNVPLTVIKSNDDYNKKITDLNKFNSNNSPAILLTDYYFVGNNVPKNINYYHITNGGGHEDLISIFEYIKVINKYSSMNNSFEIINHITSTIKGDLTLDEINETVFKEEFDKYTRNFSAYKNRANNLFLEGSQFKIENSFTN